MRRKQIKAKKAAKVRKHAKVRESKPKKGVLHDPFGLSNLGRGL